MDMADASFAKLFAAKKQRLDQPAAAAPQPKKSPNSGAPLSKKQKKKQEKQNKVRILFKKNKDLT